MFYCVYGQMSEIKNYYYYYIIYIVLEHAFVIMLSRILIKCKILLFRYYYYIYFPQTGVVD